MITDNMIRYIYIYYKETENQRRVGGRGAGSKNHQHEKNPSSLWCTASREAEWTACETNLGEEAPAVKECTSRSVRALQCSA